MGLGPQALKRNVLLLRYGTSKLVPFPIVQLLQFSARPQLPGRAAFHF
jgi:hypothetical protein